MDIKNPLIQWYMHRFHRLVQRERCASMIQTTTLVHHVLTKRQRDLVRLIIIHRPLRPDHRTEPSKMDRLVRTLFVSDSRVTCREIRTFGIRQIAPDDPLDCKVSVVQSERGLERLFPIWKTMTRKVDPFVPADLFNDSRNARFLLIYTRHLPLA